MKQLQAEPANSSESKIQRNRRENIWKQRDEHGQQLCIVEIVHVFYINSQNLIRSERTCDAIVYFLSLSLSVSLSFSFAP